MYFVYNAVVFGGVLPVSVAVKRWWSERAFESEGATAWPGTSMPTPAPRTSTTKYRSRSYYVGFLLWSGGARAASTPGRIGCCWPFWYACFPWR